MESQEDLNIQLKTVFDFCDTEKRGFISVDQLADLAKQYFGGGEQDVLDIIHSLRSDHTDVVNFEEFCDRVMAILALNRERADSISSHSSGRHSHHYDMLVPATEGNSANKLINGNRAESPLIDTDNDSAIHSTSPHPSSDRGSALPPEDSIRDGCNVSDGEDEHYECYGELSDGDYDADVSPMTTRIDNTLHPSRSSSFRSTTSSNCSSSTGTNGSNPGQSVQEKSATLPFHRRNSWLRSSIRRSSFGAGKRNPAPVVRNQYIRKASQTHSRQSSSCESGDDLFGGDLALEEDVNNLNDKVEFLQHQVSVLADGQNSSDDKYSRVKQENSGLQSRIIILEEQLKEIEVKSEERIKEEQRRTKEMMSKLEREKDQQIENYSIKLSSLQKEHYDLRDEVSRLRLLCDKLKEEKNSLLSQMSEKDAEFTILSEDHRKLQELSRREREEFCNERTSNTLLLNELTKEIEELRKYREESETVARARSPSFYEYPSRCRELEANLKSLKQKNQMLTDTYEELQINLLSKSLRNGSMEATSLASEFNECSKDQLLQNLRQTQDENTKLRSYIDGMLLNIMEKYPAILEVKGMGLIP